MFVSVVLRRLGGTRFCRPPRLTMTPLCTPEIHSRKSIAALGLLSFPISSRRALDCSGLCDANPRTIAMTGRGWVDRWTATYPPTPGAACGTIISVTDRSQARHGMLGGNSSSCPVHGIKRRPNNNRTAPSVSHAAGADSSLSTVQRASARARRQQDPVNCLAVSVSMYCYRVQWGNLL